MIVVVDYGMGNLRSVAKALEHVGAAVSVSADPSAVAGARQLVLPGVGAFGEAVRRLREGGLWDAVVEHLASGRPFLGICLGMQLLYETSEEHGRHAGFGVFPGAVRRLPDDRVKVPHIGWNQVAPCETPEARAFFAGVEPGAYVYYDQSFYCPADGPVAATTEYGVTLAAAAARGAVWAAQFHPEKSQAVGLRLLSNFVASSVEVPS